MTNTAADSARDTTQDDSTTPDTPQSAGDQPDLAAAAAGYRRFLDSCRTLAISSVDENGEPFSSYAPFVEHDGELYVYISKIAEHYWHLVNHPRVQVMALADEAGSPNLFARERVRFPCTVHRLAVADEPAEVFDKLGERTNASLITLLRTLDFSLFRLSPGIGRYVVGFGKAFDTDLAGDTFAHVVVDKRKAEIADQTARGLAARPTGGSDGRS